MQPVCLSMWGVFFDGSPFEWIFRESHLDQLSLKRSMLRLAARVGRFRDALRGSSTAEVRAVRDDGM